MMLSNKTKLSYTVLLLAALSINPTQCMKKEPISLSTLSFLPTEQPNNLRLADMRQKLNHASSKDIEAVCPYIECIKTEQPWQRPGVCFNVAMKEILQLKKKEMQSLNIIGCQDWIVELNALEYFQQTNNPRAGSLAVYINSTKGSVEHLGTVNSDGTIRSKFSIVPGMFDHPLWCLPASWGDKVLFYNLKNVYKNEQGKQLLLAELQKKADNKDLQNKFHCAEQKLLILANQQCTGTCPEQKLSADAQSLSDAHCLLKQKPYININTCNTHGHTPLMLSSRIGSLERVELFILHKADVNAQDKKGHTALYHAARKNHSDVVEYLLDNGANPYILDNKGKVANVSFTMLYRKPLRLCTTIGIGTLLTYVAYKGIMYED